jgi:hypothetical protein
VRPRTRPLTFADFELQAQGLALEATLQALADFLDEHAELVTLVHDDLVRGLKRPRMGRDGLSAAQVLRAFVLQRITAWDLRELRERIADGYTLRQFTTFDAHPVPKHDAFHRAFCRLTPATVRALNDASSRPPSRSASRMAPGSASTPPSWRRTSIGRPTARCSGMWCGCSPGWSSAWASRCRAR